jgi:hypothetical protein
MRDNIKRVWTGNLGSPTRSVSDPVHRACPINGKTVGFERLPYDPRLGEEHLKSVYTGIAWSKDELAKWNKLLDIHDVKHNHKVDCRLGLSGRSFDRGSREGAPDGSDRTAATQWIRDDEKRFESKLQELVQENKDGDHSIPGKQDLERVPPQAIGFWLFPLESLGRVPDSEWVRWEWKRHRFIDMSKHMPELCLSIMH